MPKVKAVSFRPQKDMRIGDKYIIKEYIDSGSFGTVWTALNLETEKIVALKIPRDQEKADATLSEGKELLEVKHPNIIELNCMGRVEGVFIIEMEYFKGHKLSDELTEKGLKIPKTFEQIFAIFFQVLEGVNFMHSKYICHGDIKPQNILVYREQIKITDFGTSRFIEDLFVETVDGEGTWAYMAPEIVGSNRRHLNSDIYSLGVLLYQLLTGRTPHQTSLQIINNSSYPRASEINDNITDSIDRVILKALERNPEERYQKMEDLKSDLHDALENIENEFITYETVEIPVGKNWLDTVIKFYKNNDYKSAERYLLKEYRSGNRSQDIQYHLAYTLYNQGKFFDSLNKLNHIELDKVESIRIDAFEDTFLDLRGKVCLELKKYEEAQMIYSKLSKKNPGSINYAYKLACIYALLNQEEMTIEILEKINKKTPGILFVIKKLGHAYDQRKEYGKARGYFNYALKLDPENQVIKNRLNLYKKYQANMGKL